jgi:hypothetical protein
MSRPDDQRSSISSVIVVGALLILVVLFGIAAVTWSASQQSTVFALLEVRGPIDAPGPQSPASDAELERRAAQFEALLASPLIISQAISVSGLVTTSGQPAPAAILQGRLIVRRRLSSPVHLSRMPGSTLIEMRLEGLDPREDVRIMNAVLRAFEAEVYRMPHGHDAIRVIQSPQVTP